MSYHPPVRDPVAVPTSHATVPDPSDAAADGAFGGVTEEKRTDHRAGYTRPFDELLDWARRPSDLRSSDVARLVAEIDQLRRVLNLLRQPSEDLCKTLSWYSACSLPDAIRAAVAAAEREAGR